MMRLVDGTEPGAAGVAALVERALELRAGAAPRRCDGLCLGAVFLNPSLRTRASLESAAVALGIHPIVVEPGHGAWGWELREGAVMDGGAAEHIRDAVPVLSSYVDVLAVRAFAGLADADLDRADPVITAVSGLSDGPVLNLESARWHPLQGLADHATWRSRLGPELAGRRVTLTWAPHPKALPAAVPNQVVLSGALAGLDVTVAHPEGFDLDPQVVERAQALAASAGGRVSVTHDRAAALEGAEVVVAKSWSGFSRYGDREAEAADRAALGTWKVTPADLGAAGFMHCLPVRRNVVVDDAVLDGPLSWVGEEAGLRLWTAMAVLEAVGEGAWPSS